MFFFCSSTLVVLAGLLLRVVLAYDVDVCCAIAKQGKYFLNTTADPLPGLEYQICGQQYDPNIPAAPNLFVSYDYCTTSCSGIYLAGINDLQQWAAPLVQFILPSVIFSMMVPRRKKIEFSSLFDFPSITRRAKSSRYLWFFSLLRLSVSLFLSIIIIVPVIVDTVLWITTIGIGASVMLVGGLYEGHLDYRIIKRVQYPDLDYNDNEPHPNPKDFLDRRSELLVTVVSGNLVIDPRFESPMSEICNSLSTAVDESERNEQRRSRLIAMLTAQYSFGSAVGAPVVFYLGALIYTILDLYNHVSTENAAESVAFGMEWMTVVHVAIVSGCLLASNNPSTSSAIVGRSPPLEPLHRASTLENVKENSSERTEITFPRRILVDPASSLLGWADAYPTKYQPVWIWDRGANKMEWIKSTKSWERDRNGFQKAMTFTIWSWVFEIFLPTLILIAAPPAAGAIISYYTPPIGLGCRSLTLFIYAGCQVVLAIIATIKNATDTGAGPATRISKLFSGVRFWIWSGLFLLGSFASLIGGTIMQLIGIYDNCLCDINPRDWLNPSEATPGVNFASDTRDSRDSTKYWLFVGYFATCFMSLVCYVGWWYQRLVRNRFIDTVEDIYSYSNEVNTSGINIVVQSPAERASSQVSLLRSRGSSLGGQFEPPSLHEREDEIELVERAPLLE